MSPETSPEIETPVRRRRVMVLLPLLVFLGLAMVFLSQLLSGRDVSEVPSALIGLQAPATHLQPLEGMNLPGIDSDKFAGRVTVLNVFASWCAPCRLEHPVLMSLSEDPRFVLAAINYKDDPENARRFLGGLGNPFSAIGTDKAGRTAIDWGVYGVPETFVVGRDGKVSYKHVGPLTPDSVRTLLLPEIDKAHGPMIAGAPDRSRSATKSFSRRSACGLRRASRSDWRAYRPDHGRTGPGFR